MSHLISGETDSEKLNDLPKVVWLDVAEVGFLTQVSLAYEARPFRYHTASSVSAALSNFFFFLLRFKTLCLPL